MLLIKLWVSLVCACLSWSTPASVLAAGAPEAGGGGAHRIVTKVVKETDPVLVLDVTAKYPQVKNARGNLNDFNLLVEDRVSTAIASFRSEVSHMDVFTAPMPYTNSMWITYRVLDNRRDRISVKMTVSVYTGGAHPNSYSEPITYDIRAGSETKLADVFKPNTDHLKVIAAYCRSNLQRRDLLIFPEGVEPTPDNYRVWNTSPRGLVFTFDPYQAAPYAAGPVECTVPYRLLRRMMAIAI